MRPPKGGNIKRGVCENHSYLNPDTGETGDCPKCASGEVQSVNVQRLSDFKCSVCGSKLKPVKSGPPIKLIAIIAAIVVVLGGGGFAIYKGLSGSKESTGIDTDTATIDTITVTPEPESIVEPPVGPEGITEQPEKSKPQGETPKPETPKSKKIQIPFGTYSGPDNGLDGEIKVTRAYSLDLHNAAHETIELQPGDVITKTKFKDGELKGGYWQRGSEGRSFHR